MKRSRRVAGLLIAMLILFALVSCASPSPQSRLAGRWEILLEDGELGEVPMIYHFTEDGAIYLEQRRGDEIAFSILSGSFSVEGENVVHLSLDDSHDTFTFSVSSTELILSREGMEDLKFTRVEEGKKP